MNYKEKLLLIAILMNVLLIGSFIWLHLDKNQDKINPEDFVVNLEIIENPKYEITIDCTWVKNDLNNTIMYFPEQTIDLCNQVYPELWREK